MGQELKLANDKIGELVKGTMYNIILWILVNLKIMKHLLKCYSDHTKSTKSMKKLEAQLKTQLDQFKRLTQDTQAKSTKILELENQLQTERDDNENRLSRLKKQHAKEKQNFKGELGLHLKVRVLL